MGALLFTVGVVAAFTVPAYQTCTLSLCGELHYSIREKRAASDGTGASIQNAVWRGSSAILVTVHLNRLGEKEIVSLQ
jgi:hypothetical protein